MIHFNFGIHDRNTKLTDYTNRLETLIIRMQKTGAKLVWASTTPIPDDPKQNQRAASIIEKNQAAAELMKKYHIPIDDLFATISPKAAEYQNPPPDVHFKLAGYDYMGKQVAAAVTAVLKGSPLPAPVTSE